MPFVYVSLRMNTNMLLLTYTLSPPSPDYFRWKGVCGMTVKELFEFVTDLSITDDNVDAYLDRAQEIASCRSLEDATEQKIYEEVSGVCTSVMTILIECVVLDARIQIFSVFYYNC